MLRSALPIRFLQHALDLGADPRVPRSSAISPKNYPAIRVAKSLLTPPSCRDTLITPLATRNNEKPDPSWRTMILPAGTVLKSGLYTKGGAVGWRVLTIEGRLCLYESKVPPIC